MRIRTIKPEFWKHPVYARLPDHVRLIALGLLSVADDEGYFRADPALIRSDLAPFTEDYGSITVALQKLSDTGWITLKNHPEQGTIGKVVNFRKHQVINKPSPSKLKGYYELPECSGSTTVALREDYHPEQGTGIREQGAGNALAHLPSVEEVIKAGVNRLGSQVPEPFCRAYWSSKQENNRWVSNGRVIDWSTGLYGAWDGSWGNEWRKKNWGKNGSSQAIPADETEEQKMARLIRESTGRK